MSKAYFTFCYNGVPAGTRDEFRGIDLGKDSQEYTHKYAFVVDANEDEPDTAFAQLSQEPLFHRLLGSVLFGWQDADQLVISSKPDMLPELLFADPKGFLRMHTRTGEISKLSIRELQRTCISTIKFGVGCNGCPKYVPTLPGSCYLRQVITCAKKLNWHARMLVPPERVPADDFQPDALNAFIIRAVKRDYKLSNGYCYLSPTLAREDLITPKRDVGAIPLLRYYDTCFVGTQEIDKERRLTSDRSVAAARTKKLEKDCRENCIFAPCPRFANRSNRSWVSGCREEEESVFAGPFSKERIANVYHNWMKGFTKRRSDKELSLIAYHAGRITRVFGHSMILSGFDEALENVKFITCRNEHAMYFTFEDAIEILKTPWRNGDDYENMSCCLDPPVMEEEDVWCYAEIHQHTETPGYSTIWGWVRPRILSVEWGGYSTFVITPHAGYNQHVKNITETIALFGIDHILRPRFRAVREAAYRESNQDIRP